MNNARSAANLALDLFGGLCTEVAPSDLPEGASPLCYDCDFQVGQVRTRDPLSSVFSFAGNATGANPGTLVAQTQNGVAWANPSGILGSNGGYATATITNVNNAKKVAGAGSSGLGGTAWTNPNNVASPTSFATSAVTSSSFSGASTATLAVTNFGFAVAAVPAGIQVSFDSLVAGPTADFTTYTVLLLLNGNIIGTPKNIVQAANLGGFVNTLTLGGNSDLWDAVLASSDINNSTFGVRIQGTLTTHSASVTFEVRNVNLTIFFPPLNNSQSLNLAGFGFAVPGNVTGIQVAVTGHYSGVSPTINFQLLKNNLPVGTAKTVTLQTFDTTVTMGGATDLWNSPWSASDVNSPAFGISIVASSGTASITSLDFVSIKIFLSPSNAPFNYIKTFAQDDGALQTLALDNAGTLWTEDALNNPGVLTSLPANILPGAYAKSATLSDEEWIVLSDLLQGYDLPIHGSNLDRISQCGPGAGPALIGQAANINVWSIVASPTGLTQAAASSDPDDSGHFQAVNWSAGPFVRSPGNVLTIFYQQTSTHPTADAKLVVGGGVYLNMTSSPFSSLTGTYLITSVGQGVPPGGSGSRWYFTVQVATSGNTFVGGPDTATGTYQVTLATLKTTTPAEIVVNNRVTIASAGVPAWDGTWTILATLNGAQILITSTSLTSNVATYNYTLVSGVAPTAGQQVTVTGCTNGPIVNGTSIFNVSKFAIETAGTGTFTISLNAANVVSAPESGSGIIDGTIFQFDPGLSNLGVGVDAIFGNSGGGTVTTSGNLGAGVRQAVTLFITRNGLVTAPSVPTIFETSGSTNVIQASNIAVGPPNVLGRIVAFTGADGGNFFYIPQPVTIQGAGQPTTYTATQINDNVTTSATFIFTDQVLLAATAIDIQGNNTFNQIELGPSAFAVPYANRMFYGLELNKIQNLINTSFNGGYLPNQNGISLPLGWTQANAVPDGSGGQVVPSPVFGNSYYIQNTTGSSAAVLGQISQSAYQDFYKVPIILPSFTYSVRLKARTPSTTTVGSLVIDLFSPSQNRTYGIYALALNAMTSAMQAFSGTLLTTAFTTQVPQDLQIRVYALNLPNLGDVELDRFEVYPTLQPVLTTELQGSYAGNLEAFDGNTGPLGVGTQNNQPALGAFVNYDQLYILKSNSIVSTKDSPGTEPSGWSIREVSNKVGVCGINAYDYGEEWAVFAHRSGLYIFNGSEPTPISLEIGPTWDSINWKYQQTIWVRNDSVNRRMLVGVPMPTPNQWLPNAPANANPTTPNVVLMMNYKDLTSSQAIAERPPVHVSAFGGKLMAWDMSRKWSIWQIAANYADFVTRSDNSTPLMFCQAAATVSKQDPTAQSDNGLPVAGLYTTYGFVQPETEQQYGPLLGNHRKMARYLEINAEGSGKMTFRVLPNSLTSSTFWDVPGGFTLTADPQNNLEAPLNIAGNRLYCQFSTNAVGANLSLSQITLTMSQDKWAAVRGIA